MFVYLQSVTGTLRFTVEKLTQQSGIFFENQGLLKIITKKWELTAYLDLTSYQKQVLTVQEFLTNNKIEFCPQLQKINYTTIECNNLNSWLQNLTNQINDKTNLAFQTIGKKLDKKNKGKTGDRF